MVCSEERKEVSDDSALKNGQTLSFLARAAKNQYASSYVLRLWQIINRGSVKRHYETKHRSFFEQTTQIHIKGREYKLLYMALNRRFVMQAGH